jgi:hypothetical protein
LSGLERATAWQYFQRTHERKLSQEDSHANLHLAWSFHHRRNKGHDG